MLTENQAVAVGNELIRKNYIWNTECLCDSTKTMVNKKSAIYTFVEESFRFGLY
eukprot:Pgem_evm1s5895